MVEQQSTPYTPEFYDSQSAESFESARRVLGRLFEDYRPESVLDVGCGVATWLAAARTLGVREGLGIDGDYVPRDRLCVEPEHFLARDLAEPFDLGRRFDLVVCVEVAEHLELGAASNFVDSLTRHGDLVLFSAAAPYQGGTDHRNENWLEFWARLFAERAYEPLDTLRARIWSDSGIAWWYRQNIVLFRAKAAAERILPDVAAVAAQTRLHPEFVLSALRRGQTTPFRRTLEADIAYFRRAAGPGPLGEVLDYGRDLDLRFAERAPLTSYEELEAHAAAIDNPTLSDALAPIKLRDPPLARLELAKTAPDFLCIGVQRAGTAWLYEAARSHKGFRLPPLKELNFFNRRAFAPGAAFNHSGMQKRAAEMIRRYARNAKTLDASWLRLLTHIYQAQLTSQWYEEIFRFHPDASKLHGDFTPDYAMLPEEGIAEIKRFAPNIRIILMLRDPVERILSQLATIAHQVPESAPFVDRLAREPSALARSRYDLIVPRWLSHFDNNQILILDKPESLEDAKAVLARIVAFLGVGAEGFDAQAAARVVHPSPSKPALSAETTAFLRSELAEATRLYGEWRRAAP